MSSSHARPRSIARRLVLRFASASALLLLAALSVLYVIVVRHSIEEDNAVLADKVASVRDDLRERGGPDALREELDNPRNGGRGAYFVRVLDSEGKPVAESPGMSAFPAGMFAPATERSRSPRTVRLGGKSYALAAATAEASGKTFALQIVQNRSADDRFRARFGLVTVFVLACGVGASVFVATTVTRRGLRPLADMTRTVERIQPESLAERVGNNAWPLELQPLAAAFDAMLERLEESFARLSQFSGDLAHELRTPIANMLGEAQVALSRERSGDEYRAVIESSIAECERLAAIVDSLLFLARADAAESHLHCENFDARRAMEKIASYYRMVAEEHEIDIVVEGECEFAADPLLIERAAINLLDNAVRHTPDGGRIVVTVSRADERCTLAVRDTGTGISPAHLSRVFDRFYRADESRSSAGTGLGLALVKSIAEMHGGTAEIESVVGAGTTVHIQFPATA